MFEFAAALERPAKWPFFKNPRHLPKVRAHRSSPQDSALPADIGRRRRKTALQDHLNQHVMDCEKLGSTQMGTNTSSKGRAEAQAADKATASDPAAEFADGDLGRIQSILYGEQAARTDERLSILEQSLTEMIGRISADLGQRISAIESDLGHRLSALDKRLEAHSSTTEAKTDELRKSFDTRATDLDTKLTAAIDQEVKDLRHEATTSVTALETTLATSKAAMEKAIQKSRSDAERNHSELTKTVEQRFSQSDDALVARSHLAELLHATADQLGPEGSGSKTKKTTR